MKLFIEYEISIVNKNMKILDIFHKGGLSPKPQNFLIKAKTMRYAKMKLVA